MDQKTIGTKFLENYSNGLINEDAVLMASLFHKGLAYIVNDEVRDGASSLCEVATWEYIFSKVKFLEANASELNEPVEGHIFYKEVLKVESKASGEKNEGHFIDETVINKDGKMLLVNRIADDAYFEWFNKVLS